ncbi:MAG: hypothetical protein ACHQDE_02360 [Acidimicrobiia bacterium]
MDPIPAVEREVGFDLAKRAALIAPAVLLVAFLVSGVDGLAGAALALVLVAANFVAGALSLQWAGRRGPNALAVVAVAGFLVRMTVMLGVIVVMQNVVNVYWLVGVLAVAHVGLLIWETRHLSISLAAPGLKPAKRRWSNFDGQPMPAAAAGEKEL